MFLQSIPSKVLLALITLYTLLSCPFSTLSSLELICYQPHPLFVKHKRELKRIDIADQPLISLPSIDDTEPWLGTGRQKRNDTPQGQVGFCSHGFFMYRDEI